MGVFKSPILGVSNRQKVLTLIGLVGFSMVTTQAFSGDTSYKYDALGRVIQVRYPDNTQINYAYDAAGNRVAVVKALNVASSSSSSATSSSTTSSSSSASTSSAANTAPVCTNNTVSISGSATTLSVTLQAAQFTALCTDANGDTLTVTTPTVPYSFTVQRNNYEDIPFTISDGHGGTASAVITYEYSDSNTNI